MNVNFERAHKELMPIEGGYSNRSHAADPGGETMYGVTERVARKWGYMGPMKDLPLSTAKQIAYEIYWAPYQCDQLPFAIAYQVFDTAYNGGRPAAWLQASVGVTVDGVVGAKTVAAARASDQMAVILAFNGLRLEYMMSLSNWLDNSRGWTRRIFKNIQLGLQK